MYSLKRTTEPANYPVALDEVKLYLRVDGTDEDDLITIMLKAAIRQAEDYTLRAFITQEWKLVCEPAEALSIPRPPLQSVESVSGRDCDGVITAVSESAYWVDTDAEPGRVVLKNGYIWPDLSDSIIVEFTCGYGDDATDVPEDIKLAIKRMCANWYENREDFIVGQTVSEIPADAKALLSPYRVVYL